MLLEVLDGRRHVWRKYVCHANSSYSRAPAMSCEQSTSDRATSTHSHSLNAASNPWVNPWHRDLSPQHAQQTATRHADFLTEQVCREPHCFHAPVPSCAVRSRDPGCHAPTSENKNIVVRPTSHAARLFAVLQSARAARNEAGLAVDQAARASKTALDRAYHAPFHLETPKST